MPAPIAYGFNLIEKSGVTFSVPAEAAGFPKTNAFDREIESFYQDTATTGTREYKSDQGVSGTEALDSLVVGKHNLSGATVAFESSPDNAVWTPRGSTVPANTNPFRITAAGLFTTRYSRMTITSAASPPRFSELFFSRKAALPRFPSVDGMRYGLRGNGRVHEGTAGHDWLAQRGATRRFLEMTIRDLLQSPDRTVLEAFYNEIGGGFKPFFGEDADGTLVFVRWTDADLSFGPTAIYRHDVHMSWLEML